MEAGALKVRFETPGSVASYLKVESIAKSAFILALVINKEVAKIKASFLII